MVVHSGSEGSPSTRWIKALRRFAVPLFRRFALFFPVVIPAFCPFAAFFFEEHLRGLSAFAVFDGRTWEVKADAVAFDKVVEEAPLGAVAIAPVPFADGGGDDNGSRFLLWGVAVLAIRFEVSQVVG